MNRSKRITAIVATAAIAGGGTLPAFGSSTHWSKAKCESWKRDFAKRHPHAERSDREREATRSSGPTTARPGSNCEIEPYLAPRPESPQSTGRVPLRR